MNPEHTTSTISNASTSDQVAVRFVTINTVLSSTDKQNDQEFSDALLNAEMYMNDTVATALMEKFGIHARFHF